MQTEVMVVVVILWILMGCVSGYLEAIIHKDDKWFLTMSLVIAVWIGWLAWPVIIPYQIKKLREEKHSK